MLHGLRSGGRACSSQALLRMASRWGWPLSALAWLVLGASCSGASAGAYVLSATFNGGSSVSVTPGSQIEVSVTVQLVGGDGTNSWWCSTRYELWCPETQVKEEGCVHEPSPSGGCYCNWGCLAASTAWESVFSTHFTVTAPPIAGTYDVRLCAVHQEDTCGTMECSYPRTFSDAVTVTCGPAHTPSVVIGGLQVLTCAVPSVTLTATASGGTTPYAYLWTPGNLTSQSITASTPGTYTVTVTGANGCSASDSVVVSAIDQWTELLVNGGFEKGLDGWRLYPGPDERIAPAFAATAPYFAPVNGTSCLQSGTAYLQGYAVEPGTSARLIQDVTLLLQPDHSYRLSGWIWRDATDSIGPVIALHYVIQDGATPPGGVVIELRLPQIAIQVNGPTVSLAHSFITCLQAVRKLGLYSVSSTARAMPGGTMYRSWNSTSSEDNRRAPTNWTTHEVTNPASGLSRVPTACEQCNGRQKTITAAGSP